jgi:PAS domain S-box-containing protein
MRHPFDLSPEFQPDGQSSRQKADEMMRIAKEEGNNRFEWLHLKANGKEIWMEVVLTAMHAGEQEVIYTIWRDIHAQKQAETELKKERERLALALRATGFDVWENDFVTGKVTQPDRIYKVAGYEKGEVPTEFEGVKALIHPDDLAAAFEAISRHLAGQTANYSAEFRFKRKEGGWMWLANYGRVYEKNKEGVPLKFIGLTLDITEKKETELALAALNSELEQRVEEETNKRLAQDKLIAQQSKMALMGEMIGIIAHQWKQPLNSIGLLAADLREVYGIGELDKHYMDDFYRKIYGQIMFMSETVDGFRTFLMPSREVKNFRAVKAAVDTVSLLEQLFRSKEIRVELDISETLYDEVAGFENEFKHVILNILTNAKDAYDACERCGEKRIEIQVANGGENLILTLRDYAGGIPNVIMDNLFEPYRTTKGEKGTGIGLNISRTIIERMGGELSVSNREGGAFFTICLPTVSGM